MTSPAGGSGRWIFPLFCRCTFPPSFYKPYQPCGLKLLKKKMQSIPTTWTYIKREPALWMFHQMASTEFNSVTACNTSLCLSHQGRDWGSSIAPSRIEYASKLSERIVIMSVSITHGSAAELWLCNSLCLLKDTLDPSVLMGSAVAAYLQSACEA